MNYAIVLRLLSYILYCEAALLLLRLFLRRRRLGRSRRLSRRVAGLRGRLFQAWASVL